MNGIEIIGAERIFYIWTVIVCSFLFAALVVIWSIRLKKSAKKTPANLVYRMQK